MIREYFWVEKALRVPPAETRLTDYRRSRVLENQTRESTDLDNTPRELIKVSFLFAESVWIMLNKKLGWENHIRKTNIRFWNIYCSQIIFLRPAINTIFNGESCICYLKLDSCFREFLDFFDSASFLYILFLDFLVYFLSFFGLYQIFFNWI